MAKEVKEFDKHFPTEKLKHHKNNRYLYQDEPDEEFLESVRRRGISTPLSVDKKSKTILSGHKRHKAAVALGLETVPVVFEEGLYEDEALMFLVDANKQRKCTKEARIREAALVHSAEKKRRWRLRNDAKQAGEEAPVFDNNPRDVAAEKTGLSARSVSNAVNVNAGIEEAEATGDTERAAAIQNAAKTSIKKAASVASPPKPKPAKLKPVDPSELDRKLIVKLMKQFNEQASVMANTLETLTKASGGVGHYSRGCTKHLEKLQEVIDEWAADIF
jgi:ParB-like chromosome segregation protein Spo0J